MHVPQRIKKIGQSALCVLSACLLIVLLVLPCSADDENITSYPLGTKYLYESGSTPASYNRFAFSFVEAEPLTGDILKYISFHNFDTLYGGIYSGTYNSGSTLYFSDYYTSRDNQSQYFSFVPTYTAFNGFTKYQVAPKLSSGNVVSDRVGFGFAINHLRAKMINADDNILYGMFHFIYDSIPLSSIGEEDVRFRIQYSLDFYDANEFLINHMNLYKPGLRFSPDSSIDPQVIDPTTITITKLSNSSSSYVLIAEFSLTRSDILTYSDGGDYLYLQPIITVPMQVPLDSEVSYVVVCPALAGMASDYDLISYDPDLTDIYDNLYNIQETVHGLSNNLSRISSENAEYLSEQYQYNLALYNLLSDYNDMNGDLNSIIDNLGSVSIPQMDSQQILFTKALFDDLLVNPYLLLMLILAASYGAITIVLKGGTT